MFDTVVPKEATHNNSTVFVCGPCFIFTQELLVHRTWDVAQHPEWLMFEVEGQLQIRPAQCTIAMALINHPGAIAQLNMGEGKTRVILPMLLLHWADGSRLVSSLWTELYVKMSCDSVSVVEVLLTCVDRPRLHASW